MPGGKFLFGKCSVLRGLLMEACIHNLFFRNKKKEYIKCLENRVAVLENQNKVTCNFCTIDLSFLK